MTTLSDPQKANVGQLYRAAGFTSWTEVIDVWQYLNPDATVDENALYTMLRRPVRNQSVQDNHSNQQLELARQEAVTARHSMVAATPRQKAIVLAFISFPEDQADVFATLNERRQERWLAIADEMENHLWDDYRESQADIDVPRLTTIADMCGVRLIEQPERTPAEDTIASVAGQVVTDKDEDF